MGNSTSFPDKAMVALEIETLQKKNRRSTKSKNPNKIRDLNDHNKNSKRSSSCGGHPKLAAAAMFEGHDMDDIIELIRELKRDSRGKKLLDEFVDYQTGKSTRKPRLLQLAGVEDATSREDPPILEIVIDPETSL